MNRLLKTLIAGVSALTMCVSAMPLCANAEELDTFTEESIYQTLSNEDIEELQAQSECSFAYGDFLNELPHNYTPMFSAIKESAEYVYPDDYAGAYFNEYDDNKMTLYLTNFDNLEYYQSFFDIDICHFELAEYSYNDLLSLFDYLSYDMSTLNLNAVSVDDLNNKVKVSISEELSNEEDIISYVDNLGYDTGMIEFEYTVCEPITNNSSTNYAYNGNGIEIRNARTNYSWANATVGYNAYCPSTNQYGIVTAGHLISETTSNYRYLYNKDNVLISNKRSSWIYENNSTVDATFIPFETNNNFSPSLYIRNAFNNNDIYILQKEQYISSPAMTNMTVYSFGATTGMQEGKIINLSASGISFNDGNTVVNFIQTDIVTQGGDSGGPLVFFTTTGTTKMALLGICKGSDSAYSYFCKCNVINNALGLQTYSYENS